MTTFLLTIGALVVGFAGGWYAYSKFGAKAQAAEVAISDALKK